MKSNKVRMNISREMHEWFTSIDGKTNDERMRRVIEVNDAYIENLRDNAKLKNSLEASRRISNKWLDDLIKLQTNNRILKGLLGLSMVVSIVSVGYLAYAQGWFL